MQRGDGMEISRIQPVTEGLDRREVPRRGHSQGDPFSYRSAKESRDGDMPGEHCHEKPFPENPSFKKLSFMIIMTSTKLGQIGP